MWGMVTVILSIYLSMDISSQSHNGSHLSLLDSLPGLWIKQVSAGLKLALSNLVFHLSTY